MDYKNSTMTYAYLVGYMAGINNNATYSFSEWINEANQIIGKFNIQMDDKQLEDLMDLYNGNGKHTEKINDITYIIIGDNDELDADINGDLYGIVYMENDEIKLISLAEFNELKIVPWCYENDKNAVCCCSQPCSPPSDSECNDENDIYQRCCECESLKVLDDIICIELTPNKIWKCCNCIASHDEMKKLRETKQERVVVKRITVNNVLYLLSKIDNVLFDNNTHEAIGTWNQETNTIGELPQSYYESDDE